MHCAIDTFIHSFVLLLRLMPLVYFYDGLCANVILTAIFMIHSFLVFSTKNRVNFIHIYTKMIIFCLLIWMATERNSQKMRMNSVLSSQLRVKGVMPIKDPLLEHFHSLSSVQCTYSPRLSLFPNELLCSIHLFTLFHLDSLLFHIGCHYDRDYVGWPTI